MTPLNLEQKQSIIRRLSFIEVELADLEAYWNLDYATYQAERTTRRNVERIIENLLNAALDIAKIILAGENVEVPSTYREVFLHLGKAGVIDPTLAAGLGEAIRIRNVLAHQYLDIKWETIKKFLTEGAGLIRAFVRAVEERFLRQ